MRSAGVSDIGVLALPARARVARRCDTGCSWVRPSAWDNHTVMDRPAPRDQAARWPHDPHSRRRSGTPAADAGPIGACQAAGRALNDRRDLGRDDTRTIPQKVAARHRGRPQALPVPRDAASRAAGAGRCRPRSRTRRARPGPRATASGRSALASVLRRWVKSDRTSASNRRAVRRRRPPGGRKVQADDRWTRPRAPAGTRPAAASARLDVGLELHRDRQDAVRLRARAAPPPARRPPAAASASHRAALPVVRCEVEQPEQDRGRDVVGQVADDAHARVRRPPANSASAGTSQEIALDDARRSPAAGRAASGTRSRSISTAVSAATRAGQRPA